MSDPVAVRATVKFQGVRPGDELLVNPDSEWIKGAISRGYLIAIELPEDPSGEDVERGM